MSEPGTPPPSPTSAKGAVTLTITLRADLAVEVQGPIADQMLCYALLEMAKDAIREAAKARESRILKPDGVPT